MTTVLASKCRSADPPTSPQRDGMLVGAPSFSSFENLHNRVYCRLRFHSRGICHGSRVWPHVWPLKEVRLAADPQCRLIYFHSTSITSSIITAVARF
jgi:hypothetical protein